MLAQTNECSATKIFFGDEDIQWGKTRRCGWGRNRVTRTFWAN